LPQHMGLSLSHSGYSGHAAAQDYNRSNSSQSL